VGSSDDGSGGARHSSLLITIIIVSSSSSSSMSSRRIRRCDCCGGGSGSDPVGERQVLGKLEPFLNDTSRLEGAKELPAEREGEVLGEESEEQLRELRARRKAAARVRGGAERSADACTDNG
jgi:hypothetical protein